MKKYPMRFVISRNYKNFVITDILYDKKEYTRLLINKVKTYAKIDLILVIHYLKK